MNNKNVRTLKQTLCSAFLAIGMVASASAALIQHTDQMAEVRFSGTAYELGQHVATVAGDQIREAMDDYAGTLDTMLPGLHVMALAKGMEGNRVYPRLKEVSPDGAAYIQGMADTLNLPESLLLSVAMSDEAILESQANGGMGFLQASKPDTHDPAAPAKCTTFGYSDGQGYGWGMANFDYMGINYSNLIVLNYTDENGDRRIIQTWAGLIPYGGVTAGGQPLLMNTLADQGTIRQDKGEAIISEQSTPSFYLSWDAYGAKNAGELQTLFNQHNHYTAYFSYTLIDAQGNVSNIENAYGDKVNMSGAGWQAHANHSIYGDAWQTLGPDFAAHTLERQQATEAFMENHADSASKTQVQDFAGQKPLWKGRGKMMGTVTATYFSVKGKQVDMYIQTDAVGGGQHEVHIRNYDQPVSSAATPVTLSH
ncbi:C45 family autoproteolytic acyltransferase/hydolase [Kistimonas asteriae]|uniref:C45 family autoproteolytic acyltransferase/hydolase n=1 Tax=Kistimonas asteriae TaxID=517724 RepID=UPI001BA76448|nr:C45 family autoproteolytic acyltransferase/hydolase [Kistimonas asteriae]